MGDNVKRHVPWNQRTKWPGKSSLMETQVTHLMFVHVDRKDTSVDDPRTENDEKTIAPMLQKIPYQDKHELSKRAGATKHGTMNGTHEHPPPWLKTVPGDAR